MNDTLKKELSNLGFLKHDNYWERRSSIVQGTINGQELRTEINVKVNSLGSGLCDDTQIEGIRININNHDLDDFWGFSVREVLTMLRIL